MTRFGEVSYLQVGAALKRPVPVALRARLGRCVWGVCEALDGVLGRGDEDDDERLLRLE